MIEHKEKACKGTGLAKGYGCGKMTKYRKYGLCMSCYPDWLLNSENGKIKMNKALIKAQATRKKAEAELKKGFEEKKRRNKLTTLLKSVKDVCHKYIRLRDEGKPCAACGTPYMKNFDASHFFKAELFSSIKFNEDNIHGCCIKCNRMMDGNLSEYQINLPKRIGKERFERLNELANLDKKIDHKWNREDLKKIRQYYNQKINDLKNGI